MTEVFPFVLRDHDLELSDWKIWGFLWS